MKKLTSIKNALFQDKVVNPSKLKSVYGGLAADPTKIGSGPTMNCNTHVSTSGSHCDACDSQTDNAYIEDKKTGFE